MANTKLPLSHLNVKGFDDLIGAEQITIGDNSETLATSGATIPSGTQRIICLATEAMHWNPVSTATATFAHAVSVNHFFVIEKNHIATAQIFTDDSSDQTMVVMYFGHWNP